MFTPTFKSLIVLAFLLAPAFAAPTPTQAQAQAPVARRAPQVEFSSTTITEPSTAPGLTHLQRLRRDHPEFTHEQIAKWEHEHGHDGAFEPIHKHHHHTRSPEPEPWTGEQIEAWKAAHPEFAAHEHEHSGEVEQGGNFEHEYEHAPHHPHDRRAPAPEPHNYTPADRVAYEQARAAQLTVLTSQEQAARASGNKHLAKQLAREIKALSEHQHRHDRRAPAPWTAEQISAWQAAHPDLMHAHRGEHQGEGMGEGMSTPAGNFEHEHEHRPHHPHDRRAPAPWTAAQISAWEAAHPDLAHAHRDEHQGEGMGEGMFAPAGKFEHEQEHRPHHPRDRRAPAPWTPEQISAWEAAHPGVAYAHRGEHQGEGMGEGMHSGEGQLGEGMLGGKFAHEGKFMHRHEPRGLWTPEQRAAWMAANPSVAEHGHMGQQEGKFENGGKFTEGVKFAKGGKFEHSSKFATGFEHRHHPRGPTPAPAPWTAEQKEAWAADRHGAVDPTAYITHEYANAKLAFPHGPGEHGHGHMGAHGGEHEHEYREHSRRAPVPEPRRPHGKMHHRKLTPMERAARRERKAARIAARQGSN